MTTPSLARNWQLVRHTETALRTGNESLGNVPALLRMLLEEEAWREFALPNGDLVVYQRFSEFVLARPPRGLGAEPKLIERVAGSDPDLRRMLRESEKIGKPGPPSAGEMRSDSESISSETSAYLAQRLQRDAPDEYERVRAGELSINAAAVLAGIRPRRISVRLDNPASIVASIERADRGLLEAVRDEINRRLTD